MFFFNECCHTFLATFCNFIEYGQNVNEHHISYIKLMGGVSVTYVADVDKEQ